MSIHQEGSAALENQVFEQAFAVQRLEYLVVPKGVLWTPLRPVVITVIALIGICEMAPYSDKMDSKLTDEMHPGRSALSISSASPRFLLVADGFT